MNLHVPETEEARAEAETLMQVQSHIITPKNGQNIIGCIDDSITGNYILTKDLTLTKDDAISLLISIGITDSSIFKKFKNEVHGKEIFSALLPKGFNFIGETKNKEKLEIKDGQLIKGYIDKATIGEENGSLIRSIYAKYDEDFGI